MNDRDLDALLEGLKAAPPIPPPPPIPVQAPADPAPAAVPRRWGRWAGGLALAAGLLLAVGLSQGDRVGVRGGGEEVVLLGLELSAVRGGETVRLGERAAVGEPIYFRLSSTPAAEVTLWVQGPAGREDIATHAATPQEAALQGPAGFVGYVAERPGTYTFHLAGPGAERALQVEITED